LRRRNYWTYRGGCAWTCRVRPDSQTLLAHLQHYGAGTPLLDVSTDPLIALWMVAFANADEPDKLDGISGKLFGIRRPPKDRWITPLDARPYVSAKEPSVSDSLDGKVWWYQAPVVTERLRIQRGSFLIGPLIHSADRTETTIPLETNDGSNDWLNSRMDKRGQPSNTTRSRSDVFCFVIRGSVKKCLRELLEDRSGLSVETVYPTPWNRPFIGQFSEGYGRSRPLGLDLRFDHD
jgi:hypothetical protein